MLGRLLFVLALAASTLACSESGSVAGAQDAAAEPQDAGDGITGPYLAALEVVGASSPPDGSAPIELSPSFSPHITDYYVRCEVGTNALTVSMTAASGATSALLHPTTSPSARSQTVSLRVDENEAVVVRATAGSESTEYWVRCLPQKFPQLDMHLHPDAGTPPPGYYLVGNSGTTPGYAMVLDGQGVPVWYDESSKAGVDDVDDVVPGAVSFFTTWTGAPLSVQHLQPWLTSQAAPSGTELDTHELRVLPNGDYLVLSDPVLDQTNVPSKGGLPLTGPGGGTVPTTSRIFDCEIVEFEPSTGAIVWTWSASDHFNPSLDSTLPAIVTQLHTVALDPFHCNSIDVDSENGNLLVSSRNMSSIFYVERSTGTVLWKMGGSTYTMDNAIYIPIEDPFIAQHDARLQPGWSATLGAGQISVFDDESYTMAPARGLLLDVNTGADGTTPGAKVAWQYKASTNSSDRGSFRISPDGSRVIGWGTIKSVTFTEVDEEGHDLLDFVFDDGNVSYRAIKVPLSAFDLDVLRRTTGLRDEKPAARIVGYGGSSWR